MENTMFEGDNFNANNQQKVRNKNGENNAF